MIDEKSTYLVSIRAVRVCWRMKHFMLSLYVACVLSSFTLCCMCFIVFHCMLHVFYLLSLYVACVLSSSTVCCMRFIFFHFMLHVFLSSFTMLVVHFVSDFFDTRTLPGSRPSLQGYILTQFPGLKRHL